MTLADKDYFLDENKQLTADETKAAFLLIRKGQEITPDIAERYAIGKGQKSTTPAENKKAIPTANKSEKSAKKQ